jgi:hypothetical protein
MQRIHDATAATTLPAPPTLTGPVGYFTGGVPGVVTPTIVRDWWLNMLQEELLALLTAAGITPDTTGTNFTQVLAAIRGGAIPHGALVFFATGSFTVPTGVTRLRVRVLGGGGGGGGSSVAPQSAGGGGAGGMFEGWFVVSSGAVYSVTIGANGLGAALANTAGANGGTTSFGALCSATGGFGGGAAGNQGGVGGSGSGSGLSGAGMPGLPGSMGMASAVLGGTGGSSSFGGGGLETPGTGSNATGYGAGGSGGGGAGFGGGAGSAGLAIVEW